MLKKNIITDLQLDTQDDIVESVGLSGFVAVGRKQGSLEG